MHPTTIIELAILFGAALGIGLLTLLFFKKARKIVWMILCIVFVLGVSFYVVRPFIVQYQTKEAIEGLEKHFQETYPEDSWRVTDTDEHRIKSVVYLHVIFDSEPKIVYEYTVKNTIIDQVDMWMLSGDPVEDSGGDPQHEERN